MAAVPLITDVNSNFVERWLILVTPGYYEEEVRMKPFVSLMGLDHDSTYIAPPKETGERIDSPDGSGRRAGVYLNYFTSVSNLILLKPDWTSGSDYSVWNRNVYDGVSSLFIPGEAGRVALTDVSKFGLNNIDMMPAASDSLGKAILFEGNWTTAIMSNILSGYLGSDGYNVEISGNDPKQGADCHLSNCFFDSLFITRETGGCISVGNIQDVHVRGSLLRIASGDFPTAPGAGVAVQAGGWVTLEGASLQAATGAPHFRVLDVDDAGQCDFYHSSTDSFRGRAANVRQGSPLPSS